MSSNAPSPDAGAHLDLDTLADVLAGEAGAGDRTHLQSCASCTSRLAELQAAEARVVAVLSTLPPPAVPEDLAERLSAALAGQAPLRSTGASVSALPAASPRRRTWMPAAAAAVLLVSGAGIGWSLVDGAGGGSDDADTAAGAGPEVVVSASGTDYADPAAVTAALPGVLTQGEVRTFSLEDSADRAAGTSGGAADSSAPEGTARAEAQAPAALSAADPLERLRTPDGLADCLAGLQATPDEAPVEPLALDFATYDGEPALAVVLVDPDPAKLSIFVVGPGCAAADADLRHFVRVDAP